MRGELTLKLEIPLRLAIPLDVLERVDEDAARRGISREVWITEAVKEWVDVTNPDTDSKAS